MNHNENQWPELPSEGIYAVITGDIIGSRQWKDGNEKLLNCLGNGFDLVTDHLGLAKDSFQIYRGDSFQGLIPDAENALRAAFLLRTHLIASTGALSRRLDARIAIGVGTITSLPYAAVGKGDGPAFRLSGMELDGLKKKKRDLAIRTPWPALDDEFSVECVLFDVIARGWSAAQAEAVKYSLQKYTQVEIAERLKIMQPTVHHHLRAAGMHAVEAFVQRYEYLLRAHLMRIQKRGNANG